MSARVGWDISHVRAGLVATAGLAAVGGPLAWWLRGGTGALWALFGLAIVAAFFSLSAVVVAIAGRIGDVFTLPAALGTYLLKVIVLGVVMVSVRDRPDLDVPALATAVIGGTVLWSAVHCRRVWTAKLYYVDPH